MSESQILKEQARKYTQKGQSILAADRAEAAKKAEEKIYAGISSPEPAVDVTARELQRQQQAEKDDLAPTEKK